MTAYDTTTAKIQQLPAPLVQEVSDFIDFLWLRRDNVAWESWTHFAELLKATESDFADYLPGLEEYEDRLARGEIQWQ
jgi:hypothetical protein